MTPHTASEWIITCFAYIGMMTTAFALGWYLMTLWIWLQAKRLAKQVEGMTTP
jgi:hypothetical protein